MKQFTLDLNENVQRPVARLTNWHQFDVMLDTGALFPVWVDEEKALEKLGAKCVKQNVTFGGFGASSAPCRYQAQNIAFNRSRKRRAARGSPLCNPSRLRRYGGKSVEYT